MKARGTRSGDQRLALERATHLDRLYLAVAKALDKLVDAVGLNLGAISFAEVGGCFMRAPQRSRRVFREDVVAGLDSFVTGVARVHYLFVGERFEVFTKIRVTPTARRGILLGILLHKLQVPVGCISGNERLRFTERLVVLL